MSDSEITAVKTAWARCYTPLVFWGGILKWLCRAGQSSDLFCYELWVSLKWASFELENWNSNRTCSEIIKMNNFSSVAKPFCLRKLLLSVYVAETKCNELPITIDNSTRPRQSKRWRLVCCLFRKISHSSPIRTEPVRIRNIRLWRKCQPASPWNCCDGSWAVLVMNWKTTSQILESGPGREFCLILYIYKLGQVFKNSFQWTIKGSHPYVMLRDMCQIWTLTFLFQTHREH